MGFYNDFQKLKWGFVFILLDFNLEINGLKFDILPDVIGYILFFIGLAKLAEVSFDMLSAKKLSLVMIIIFALEILFFMLKLGPVLMILSIVSSVVQLVIVYKILSGIKELTVRYNKNNAIIEESDIIWKYNIILIILVFGAFLVIFIPFINILYIIGAAIFAIYVTIKTISFMNRCAGEFSILE